MNRWDTDRSTVIHHKLLEFGKVMDMNDRKVVVRVRNWITKGTPVPTRPPGDSCELCGKPYGDKVCHLDHCHATGVFRGWLCKRCNSSVGALGDTKEGLQRAIKYLESVN